MVKISEVTSNPAPVGLFAFGLTTFVYSLYHAQAYPMNTMILAMALTFGGLAQLIVGIMEWKKNNVFASTIFLSFGCFWLSIFVLYTLPYVINAGAPDGRAMGTFFFVWGLFTVGLLTSALIRSPWIMSLILFLTIVNMFFLMVAHYSGSVAVEYIAGVVGVIIGVVSMYAATGEIYNETFGKVVFPFGIREKVIGNKVI